MAGSRQTPRRLIARASGHVQDVSYRAFCADEAMRLHVEGYARNLPDGRTVEVVAEAGEMTLRAVVEDGDYRGEDPTGEFVGFEAVI